MSVQELGAFLILALAAGYLVRRRLRRRAAGNCCGEKECPAAAGIARRIERARG